VYVPGFQLDPVSRLARYVELAGRAPAIIHWFQRRTPDGEFPAGAATVAREHGALPMVSWDPSPGRLEPIAAGEHDPYLRRYAAAAATYREPILLRIGHEMNLKGIPWAGAPQAFIEAWQRIRSIFAEEGAVNVRFVWSPHVLGRNAEPFDPYYPGDRQVDWLALDGYNWGRRPWRNHWASFDAIFGDSYRAIVDLAPGTPLMLAEVGSAELGGDKPAWMRESLLQAIPDRYPLLRAVVWFDRFPRGHADWRIDSSPGALAAWRDAVADPRYSLTGRELAGLTGG
jgi:hypothetical protein